MEFSLINLLLVLLVAWITGGAAKRLGYPAVLGELLAGILFGPALFGFVHGSPGLDVLAEIGVFLMMLYIGMEVDYRSLLRSSKGGLLAAIGGFVVPYVLGYGLTLHFGFSKEAALFLGLAMGVTSLATKSRIIVDLGLVGTRISSVLFSGALICDAAALIVFALIMGAVGEQGVQFDKIMVVSAKAALFFGTSIYIGLRLFPLIGQGLKKFGFAERTTSFTLVIMIGLIFAEMAELAGLHSILGAFFAGLFLKEGVLKRKLSHDVSQLVRTSSFGFLAPIFFVNAGFHVDLGVFQTDLGFLALVLVVATLGKILGTMLFYIPSGHGWREGLAIGAGMNGRGAVEIIIAEIALEKGIITKDIFSVLVIMAFVTTITVPILLKLTTEWLRRRDELKKDDDSRKGAIIFGVSPLSCIYAKEIAKYEPVQLIDSSAARCALARNEGLSVTQGNVLDTETLEILQAQNKRIFLATTTNSAVNSLAIEEAQSYFSIPEIYRFDRPEDTHLPSTSFFGDVENFENWARLIEGGQVEVKSINVKEKSNMNDFFNSLTSGEPFLPILLERNTKLQGLGLTAPDFSLLEGDVLKVLRPTSERFQLDLAFRDLILKAPILDFEKPIESKDFFQSASSLIAERVGIDADLILESFLKEEKRGNPSLTPGVAIPHTMVDQDIPFSIVISRCQKGIPSWGTGGQPKIIVAILLSPLTRNMHLHVLSNIAQILQSNDFEKRWMNAASKDELRSILLPKE